MQRLKNIFFTTIIALFAMQAFAQDGYKRYPMLEHFTNTWCSVCASRNPGMFAYLNNYNGTYHHMSIHPNIPYQGCIFYQANPTENNARKNFYSVSSTPRVFLNGTLVSTSAALLPPATFEASLNQKSPIGIEVTETTGTTRNVKVSVHTAGVPPTGNFKLYAAIVEKTINYASPNGEQVHHNVFRKFLTPPDGSDFAPAANGGKVESTFAYNVESGWNAAETYVVVFIQNAATKEVLNSGTRFDNFLLSQNDIANEMQLSISPNPAGNEVFLSASKSIEQITVFDLTGRLVAQQDVNQINASLQVSNWKQGIYLVKVHTATGTRTERLVVMR